MIRVLAMVPILDIEITTEVVDDEEQHVVTAGAIITVTVVLNRRYVGDKTRGRDAGSLRTSTYSHFRTMESEMSNTNGLLDSTAEDAEDQEQDLDDLPDDIVELSAPGAGEDSESNAATAPGKDEEAKKKAPVWKKPDKKKKKGGAGGGGGAPNKQKQKAKKKVAEAVAGEQEKAQVRRRRRYLEDFLQESMHGRITGQHTCRNMDIGFPAILKFPFLYVSPLPLFQSASILFPLLHLWPSAPSLHSRKRLVNRRHSKLQNIGGDLQ